MTTPILVLNSGSSSIKYELIDMDGPVSLAQGLVERIGEATSRVEHDARGITHVIDRPLADHREGLAAMAEAFEKSPPLAPMGSMDAKDWEKSIATNIRATGLLIPMVDPLLRAAPSGAALFFDDPKGGAQFYGAYGATKAAQIALARSWQAEGAKHGPRVVIAEPAAMPTAVRARFHPGEDRAKLADVRAEAARLLDLLN